MLKSSSVRESQAIAMITFMSTHYSVYNKHTISTCRGLEMNTGVMYRGCVTMYCFLIVMQLAGNENLFTYLTVVSELGKFLKLEHLVLFYNQCFALTTSVVQYQVW